MYGSKKLKMKYYIILVLLLPLSCMEMPTNGSETFNLSGNHFAIAVKDLKKTGDFYANTLKINEIDISSTGLPHRWFKLNKGLEIHLVSSDKTLPKKTRNNHLAIQTNNINVVASYLKGEKIEYYDWLGNSNTIQERFDGVLQIYLTDPEGNWIEINQKAKL
jgi:catechol 2,3-dioxygenase-like lactoylglutathione lyase family enzyme